MDSLNKFIKNKNKKKRWASSSADDGYRYRNRKSWICARMQAADIF
jgi:hypothetical protein